MSLTYAIPDIHGRLDLLDAAFARIGEHSKGASSTVVTLGDYIDRGPSSRQVIDRLICRRADNLTLVNLKGNHEAMMWETCNNVAELSWWIKNGGDQTLASYGISAQDASALGQIPGAHLDWIANLPLLHIDPYRVFVHAAVDPDIPLHRQNEMTLLWKRYPHNFNKGHGHRHVVHGHHATTAAPVATDGKTNLDGLAWKTGRLVIGVFENSRPGGASDFLEVIAAPYRQ